MSRSRHSRRLAAAFGLILGWGVLALAHAGSPTVGSCPVFPADNAWNLPVADLPRDPRSAGYVAYMDRGGNHFLHADFGENPDYGIPYQVVDGRQLRVPVTFTEYGDESDPGPYPIPSDARVEAGSDAHLLVVDASSCKLYELYHAGRGERGWEAGSGAIFSLRSNALRPLHWTSADAAGLPIFPGLARLDEVQAGEIRHALRVTAQATQAAFVHPARHLASSNRDPDAPPMGLRLRLRADYDLSRFHGQALVILTALKRYGMIVADNGTSWYISGGTSPGWNDEDLDQLKTVPGRAFEAVKSGPLTRRR